MFGQLKVFAVVVVSMLMLGCAAPQGHYGYAARPVYVQLPPAPAPQPRQILIRTETHQVIRPRIVMEPCCRMAPNVIYVR